MHNTGMLVSDVLTAYVNGKPADSALWQSLEDETRVRLARAIVSPKQRQQSQNYTRRIR
jgi:hypothetical protein